MLETVSEYAAEQLRRSDEWQAIHDRHRQYFLRWAEEVELKLRGSDQGRWFARLESDHDNLRSALEWSEARAGVEEHVRLVVALARFWDTHGHLREGRARIETALRRSTPEVPARLRFRTLVQAGWMAHVAGDHGAARGHYRQAISLAWEMDDRLGAARTLRSLGQVAQDEGNLDEARALFEEAVACCPETGYDGGRYWLVNALGGLALRQGNYRQAHDYLGESLTWWNRSDNRQGRALAELDLAMACAGLGKHEEARALGATALRTLHECGAIVDVPQAIEQMACLAAYEKRWRRTARLLGAAEGLRRATGASLAASLARNHAEAVDAADQALGRDVFDAAFAEGAAMNMEDAVAFALDQGER